LHEPKAFQPFDPAGCRILISNDDGISAPGIEILERIAREISDDVWVVAPETEQSGASHSLTLQRPLRIRKLAPQRFAVDGTPTDAVLLALKEILRGSPPQLLLSGVNRGSNLGEDVTYSGTVAAAMEGTLLGVPSIAFSLATGDRDEPLWETALAHGPHVVRRLTQCAWPAATLMNVNFPDCRPEEILGMRAVRQGRRHLGNEFSRVQDPRGRTYYWVGATRDDVLAEPDTDLKAVAERAIAVTPISLDLTHRTGLETLRAFLS
jgi:5'-nucleotidase